MRQRSLGGEHQVTRTMACFTVQELALAWVGGEELANAERMLPFRLALKLGCA